MVFYEYLCRECSHRFQVRFKMGEAPATVGCLHCGTVAMKVFSPAVPIFKGSGFYSTDYRGEK